LTPPAAPFGQHGEGTPLVSVVLATFNRANLLEDTLRMVLAQTFDDFELIICDDCSTDETPAVVAEWAAREPRIQYVRQPRNLGLAGNVSRGIALAKAELIAVLYDGDVYDPRLLDRWVAALHACPEAAFVFNAYNRLGADGGVEVTYREHLDSCVPGQVLLERLYFRRWRFSSPVWGTVMLRKGKYVAAGGLDTRFSFVADVDLYLRLAENNCVAYVPEPLIGLASRQTVPKLFRPPPRRVIRRAFREARVRHYRRRPLRLLAEMLRHWTFAAMDVAVGPIRAAVSGWQRPSPVDQLRRRLIQRRPQQGMGSLSHPPSHGATQGLVKAPSSSVTASKIGMEMVGRLLSLAGRACLGAKEYVDCFGLTRGLVFLLLAQVWPHAKTREVKVTVPGHSVSVLVRPGTTDVSVFNTTYRSKQYNYDFAKPPKVIIDAGAYTGLSAAYFASTYPEAKVIAIEPDSVNFGLLVRNTSGLANVQAVRAALWSSNRQVELTDPGNGAWAFRVAEMGDPGSAGLHSEKVAHNRIPAITIPEIINTYSLSRIDLLKLDIEGSEKEVFAGSASWLAQVGAICIELHDKFEPGCSREFYRAVGDFPAEFRRGETVLVMRADG